MGNNNDFLMLLQARLDEAKSRDDINKIDIPKLQSELDKLKVQVELDPKAAQSLADSIGKLINQKIVISNIGVDTKAAVKTGQDYGKQFSQGVSQGMSTASKSTEKILRDFSELNDVKRKFVDGHDLISKDDIADAEKLYDTVRKAFSEFGQVTVSKGSMNDGSLENMRVKIEQVNGEMKITRDFMLYFNESKNGFRLADDDTIRTTEKMVQHLNEGKNIINATNEEANAIKEKLVEQEKYYGKLGQATKEQITLEKQRITAGEKQLEILDAQSKRRESRISYNEGQIDKKGLSDISKQRKINDLNYSGKEKLDASFAKEIDKTLSSLSKLKDKWQEQGVYVNEFKSKVETLEKSLNEISIGDIKGLNQFKEQLSSLSTEAKELVKVNEIQLSMDTGETESKVDALIAKTQQWTDESNNARISTDNLTKAFDALSIVSDNYANNPTEATQKALIDAEKELDVQIKTVTSSIKKRNAEFAKDSAVDSLRQKYLNFYNENGKAHKRFGTEIQDTMNKLAHGAEIPKAKLEELKQRLIEISNECVRTGKTGQTWFQNLVNKIKQLSTYLSGTVIIGKILQTGKQVVDAVSEIDAAMIELKKVSSASASEISKYFDEAAESAKRYGTAVNDMINATADWSRLGYNLPDSKRLAEIATLYTNVGDGIDMNTANEHLISTLQGFQLEAEDALGIIDRFNEVANNFPIDTAGIGEALQRSAASFYAANTDLSKSIALITGTNSVVQDPDSVGTMWKTVSMRIRGVTQELEEAGLETDGMVESTAQLRDLVQGLTGFDIMADEAGTQFKDIYDIVVGIGHEWKNLTDVEQAGLLEALAGKRQGNALSAALNNISMIEEAYKTAENSAGSALKEQEEYEKGIEYSLNRLEAVYQTFANHILDSKLVKGIIDFGSNTIEVIDKVTSKLGSLRTIGLGVGLFTGFKNVGRPKMFGLICC